MANDTEWTLSVPEAGKRYYGLGRNGSYAAAGATFLQSRSGAWSASRSR